MFLIMRIEIICCLETGRGRVRLLLYPQIQPTILGAMPHLPLMVGAIEYCHPSHLPLLHLEMIVPGCFASFLISDELLDNAGNQ